VTNIDRDRANGARLRLLRGDKTQAQVAKDLHITSMMLSQYERGVRRPSDETKILLARYYGTTVSSIFFVDE
jgi:transcriptional regulator with XRE-family HTH domain